MPVEQSCGGSCLGAEIGGLGKVDFGSSQAAIPPFPAVPRSFVAASIWQVVRNGKTDAVSDCAEKS